MDRRNRIWSTNVKLHTVVAETIAPKPLVWRKNLPENLELNLNLLNRAEEFLKLNMGRT